MQDFLEAEDAVSSMIGDIFLIAVKAARRSKDALVQPVTTVEIHKGTWS
jgi:hypothetical protein